MINKKQSKPSRLALRLRRVFEGDGEATKDMLRWELWSGGEPTSKGMALLRLWWPEHYPLAPRSVTKPMQAAPVECVVTWKDESTSTTNGAPGCRVGIHACARTNCTGRHVCKCGAVHAVLVPPFGHHRIQVTEEAPLLELDDAAQEAMAKQLEGTVSLLRHKAEGRRVWASISSQLPKVWMGMHAGGRDYRDGPVLEQTVRLVVADTFKVGP